MSITNLRNYGNVPNIKQDSIVIENIIDNQGMNFIIDNLAEYIANRALSFKLNYDDTERLRDSIIGSLVIAINERI